MSRKALNIRYFHQILVSLARYCLRKRSGEPWGPSLWGPLGPYMDPYGPYMGPIWALLGPYGPLWALMGPIGPYGPLWALIIILNISLNLS